MSKLQNIREKGMKSDESINKPTERIIREQTVLNMTIIHRPISSVIWSESVQLINHSLVASVSRFPRIADINVTNTFLFHPETESNIINWCQRWPKYTSLISSALQSASLLFIINNV